MKVFVEIELTAIEGSALRGDELDDAIETAIQDTDFGSYEAVSAKVFRFKQAAYLMGTAEHLRAIAKLHGSGDLAANYVEAHRRALRRLADQIEPLEAKS